MQFELTTTDLSSPIATDCWVIPVFEKQPLPTITQAVDNLSNNALSRRIKAGDVTGKRNSSVMLYDVPGIPSERVLLIGCGDQPSLKPHQFCELIKSIAPILLQTNAKTAMLVLADIDVSDRDEVWKLKQVVQALRHKAYRFEGLKSQSKAEPIVLERLYLALEETIHPNHTAALKLAMATADGQDFCRDLGNSPANICTPTYLAETAVQLSQRFPNLRAQVLEEADMQTLGMNAFLSVSRGSRQPAKLIILEYCGGENSAAPIVLVGKGVTFDSGGISLKPALNMEHMKYDMAGAASVMGALLAVATAELPVNLTVVVPATENLPDGQASKPGDIVTSLSGQTIEIINTDAEGRLILCDALTYCERFKPAVVIDVATLTGAMLVSLGHQLSGVFTEDEALASELIQAGETSEDRMWRLPLEASYQSMIDSDYADMMNSAGRFAGSITAACFLSRFTKAYRWAHLDVAGTAMGDGKKNTATARPVPALVQFIVDQLAHS